MGRALGWTALLTLVVPIAGCGDQSEDESSSKNTGGASKGGAANPGGAGGTGATGGVGASGAGGFGVGGSGLGGTAGSGVGGSGVGGAGSGATGGATPCTTRITYGSSWLSPANHPADYDDVAGLVTWDGSCGVDAAGNAFATLSNGFKPFFKGRSCIIALDSKGDCNPAPGACATRVAYGPSWKPAPNHPLHYDDVSGVVTWDGVCHPAGGDAYARLSNGWTPYFTGSSGCDLAFRHTQCGGLFENPVFGSDCPDPGVLAENGEYFMVCTSGGPGYPIRSSLDLVSWTFRGTVFDAASKPSWASGDFWAPELHKVGGKFVVYFSARNGANNALAVGAASATNILGPYTDIGKPLVDDPNPGVIDAHYFRAPSGEHYLLWKLDGNAVGKPTPIRIQPLAPDGLSRTGTVTTLITNTLGWEGGLVEGPWMIHDSGWFYLFYSANGYASPSYAVGVARASSPLGPFTKFGNPILVSKPGWAGPGHGSVVKGPKGEWVHVYHSWVEGKAGQAPGRLVLVDRVRFENDWPTLHGGPTSRSQPLP